MLPNLDYVPNVDYIPNLDYNYLLTWVEPVTENKVIENNTNSEMTDTFQNLDLYKPNIAKFIPSPYKVHEIKPIDILGRSFKHIIPCEMSLPNLVTKNDALKRLDSISERMLSSITWDHIILAGGSISLALCDYDLSDDHYTASDLDLFVWGPDRKLVIDRLISELRSQLDIRVFQRGRVCTIIVRNKTRNIQIIDSHHESLFDILNGFDFTTSMAAYDGTNFMVTPQYMFSIMTHTTFSRRNPISLARLTKNLLRGFNVLIDHDAIIKGSEEYTLTDLNKVDVINESSALYSLNKYLFWTNESESRLVILMKALFGKEYNLVTGLYECPSNKDWKSDYDKVNLDNTELKVETRNFYIDKNHINKCYIVNSLEMQVAIKLSGVIVIGCEERSEYYSGIKRSSIFRLVVLLNKEHEALLLPYRQLLSSTETAKHAFRNREKRLLAIYKNEYYTDDQSYSRPLIYPFVKNLERTNCYRGKIPLTVSDCRSLTQRHSLCGDIIVSPYICFPTHTYKINFRLKSFYMKHKCEDSNVL